MPDSYSFAPAYDRKEPIVPNWKLTGSEVVWDEDAPDPVNESDVEPDETFDPADHTVDDVKAWVQANPDYVAEVLEAEEGGKNRVTLVDWLSDFEDT